MNVISVIVGSTREGRFSERPAHWIFQHLRKRAGIDARLLDLARAAATGRTVHHLFTGYLVAKADEIKLLRETFNPLAMAQAQLPNGVADIGPPGDEVHSF
ncbi:MAG TPA: NAD(P)H-dependent oxidoreductase [Steroidobacteraceae bacterium]|jgi:hypothetical protein